MRSSYTGFGYGSLKEDAEDLKGLLQYLKEIGMGRVILIGSSTGELMHYYSSETMRSHLFIAVY